MKRNGTMIEKLSPIQKSERIQSIDVIRGFAILGIFFVNMQDFAAPWLYLDYDKWFDTPINSALKIAIDIFAQASFYTLFSFLFGFGFIIFKERAEQKGLTFPQIFSKRLFILLVIGVIHAFLIWHGDILITYAITGFILLLFHKRKAKTMLIWALTLIMIPSTIVGHWLFTLNRQYPNAFGQSANEKVLAEQSFQIYGSGTYVEMVQQRITDWLFVHGGIGILFVILSLLPMFLLGAYVAKKRWFHEPVAHKKVLTKLWFFTLSVFVLFKTSPYWFEKNAGIEYVQDSIGGPASALFYAISITLFVNTKTGKNMLRPFRYIGRMSLSNYLFQSIVCTLLFYNYGFGLYGKVSPFIGFLIVIVIYIIQIILSKLWLSHYRIGPAEWVWRSLTYGYVQPLKESTVKRG
jgi:uncharacterized protein